MDSTEATLAGDLFETIDPARLDMPDTAHLDTLPFAVIGLSASGITETYNETAERYGGMQREAVLGHAFFMEAGLCMNNFLVSQRFDDEPELDAILDYILTYRMRPTPVKLRLLRRPDLRRRYLLIKR
jgi:photoactive yellow protein